MSQFETLQVEIVDSIAKVTIDRPKALNALNEQVLRDVLKAFHDFQCQGGIRGAYITGSGDKAFVAGADIASMKGMTALQAKSFCDLGHRALKMVERASFPVVAAVNGFALGGGLELALACDFIYASKNAKLGLPEVNLGLFPGFGGTQRLSRLIGKNRAKEMVFSANHISAEKAYDWGIVNQVVETEELIPAVEKILKTIAAKGPVAVSLSKRVMNEGTDLSLDAGLSLEQAQFPLVFATEDCQEGVTAFLEKRAANFQSK